MLKKMGWATFCRWMEYDLIEPIGDRRGDWQAAAVGASVFNGIARLFGSKQRIDIREYLLDFSTKDKEGGSTASEDQRRLDNSNRMQFIARQMTALYNAEEERKKKKRG